MSPDGEEVRLCWVGGVLQRVDGGKPVDDSHHRFSARMAFLDALDTLTGQRRSASHSARAGNYAPKEMKAAGLAEGFSKADLKRAMNALFADQEIVASAKLWQAANRTWVVGIARKA